MSLIVSSLLASTLFSASKNERQQIENDINSFNELCDKSEAFFNKINSNENELFELKKEINRLDRRLVSSSSNNDNDLGIKVSFLTS
jgi:hypothetical protein